MKLFSFLEELMQPSVSQDFNLEMIIKNGFPALAYRRDFQAMLGLSHLVLWEEGMSDGGSGRWGEAKSTLVPQQEFQCL